MNTQSRRNKCFAVDLFSEGKISEIYDVNGNFINVQFFNGKIVVLH